MVAERVDFNCNSFTSDCVGFLTGGSIPSWIKGTFPMLAQLDLALTRHSDLPSDFLSTPFGAALRPTIDAMFRRPTGFTPPAAAGQQPSPGPASSLLQGVADRATARDSGYSTPSSSAVAGAIHVSTNPASFRSLLESHRAVVAMFTSATCGPCRMIEPVFEDIAHAKTRGRAAGNVAFAKVDLAVGMSGAIARQYNVAATPTFGFFLDGKRVCFFGHRVLPLGAQL
jgi:thiol-disulfide isomerase/thioredoxin